MISWIYSILNLIGFGLTFIIEFFIYWIGTREKAGKVAIYTLLINAFTWPLASLFSTPENLIFIELVVFCAEFILIMLLFKIKWWKALLISLIANLLTMIIGLWI